MYLNQRKKDGLSGTRQNVMIFPWPGPLPCGDNGKMSRCFFTVDYGQIMVTNFAVNCAGNLTYVYFDRMLRCV